MPSEDTDRPATASRPPSAAARRALAEAEARRAAAKAAAGKGDGAAEVGGPEGPEPTRYGDWERNGLASDF